MLPVSSAYSVSGKRYSLLRAFLTESGDFRAGGGSGFQEFLREWQLLMWSWNESSG